MLQFILGRANSGKTQYIYDQIAFDAVSGRGAVVLMVPEQSSFDSERGLLGRLGASGSAMVEVMTFSRLSELIFEEVGTACGIAVDEAQRVMLMTRVLQQVAPSLKMYSSYCKSPEFVLSLLSSLDEIKQAGLSSEDMMSISNRAESDSLKWIMHDFSLISASFEELLGRNSIDNIDRLTLLYDLLPDSDYFDGKRVYFDGFDSFTGQQYKIIDRILSRADDVFVSFPADNLHQSGDLGVFSNIKSAAAQIIRSASSHGIRQKPPIILEKSHFSSDALTLLEASFAGVSNSIFEDKTDDVTVISCADPYDEAEFVARAIRRMVRTLPDCRYKDFVVIARDISDYSSYISSAFKKYDIPLFIDENRSSTSMPLMSYVTALLSAADSLSADDIFRMLKTGLCSLNEDEINDLENYCYIWNINGEKWLDDFVMSPRGFKDERAGEDDLCEIERLNSIRKRVVEPLLELRDILRKNRPALLAKGIYNHIISNGIDVRLKEIDLELQGVGENETADLYARSYDALIDLLSHLYSVFGDEEQPFEKTLDLIETVISCLDIGRIPQMLDSVIAGSAEKIRPNRPKYTFLLGFTQSSYPNLKKPGLISISNRKELIRMDVNIPDCRLKSSIDESYLIYKILFSCYSKLYILYPRNDSSGISVEPSSYLDRIKAVLPDCTRLNSGDEEALSLDMIENAQGALASAAPFWNDRGELVSAVKLSLEKSELSDRVRMLERVNERIDNNIDPNTAKRLFGKNLVLYASGIETFKKCRFSYFCRYGLGAKRIEKAQMDSRLRGTAIHYVLDGLVKKYGPDFKNTTKTQRDKDVARLLAEHKQSVLGGRDYSDIRLSSMLERMKILLCEIADRLFDEFSSSDFEPSYSELSVGYKHNDSVPALKIPISDGVISIIGSVDRVDTLKTEDKLIFRVIDYKTYDKKFALPNLLYGLDMQMLIYMTAVKRGGIKSEQLPLEEAGILYMPVRRQIIKPEEGESERYSKVRQRGLLIDDEQILTSMDKTKSNRFVPVTYNKDGSPGKKSPIISAEEMQNIEEYIICSIAQMGEELHSGNISVNPLDGKSMKACEYCDYASVCLTDSGKNTEVADLKKDEVLDKIKIFLENKGGDTDAV